MSRTQNALGRSRDLLCCWCLLRLRPGVPLSFICDWLRAGGDSTTLLRGHSLPLKRGAYVAHKPSNTLGAIKGDGTIFEHRTSWNKRQSIRHCHKTFDQRKYAVFCFFARYMICTLQVLLVLKSENVFSNKVSKCSRKLELPTRRNP